MNANNMPKAIEVAKGCAMVKDGSGSVEVALVLEM